MEAIIRPSAALRNNYSEISRTCREERTPVIITKNGIGDTVLMGLQEYNQMTAELELLRTLADAEEDVAQGRVAPVILLQIFSVSCARRLCRACKLF